MKPRRSPRFLGASAAPYRKTSEVDSPRVLVPMAGYWLIWRGRSVLEWRTKMRTQNGPGKYVE
jgi:hypothetical protein